MTEYTVRLQVADKWLNDWYRVEGSIDNRDVDKLTLWMEIATAGTGISAENVQEVDELPVMSIKQLHDVSKQLWKKDPLESTKEREYVIMKTALWQVAREMGHKLVPIAKYSGWCHASIIHALKAKITHSPEYKAALNKLRVHVKETDVQAKYQ